MGHDISQLGKHNLKTDNIEALAFDLSKRLKVNVEFGYQNSFQWSNKTIKYDAWITRFDLCHRFRFYCASDFGQIVPV